jgi:hypothetical protein
MSPPPACPADSTCAPVPRCAARSSRTGPVAAGTTSPFPTGAILTRLRHYSSTSLYCSVESRSAKLASPGTTTSRCGNPNVTPGSRSSPAPQNDSRPPRTRPDGPREGAADQLTVRYRSSCIPGHSVETRTSHTLASRPDPRAFVATHATADGASGTAIAVNTIPPRPQGHPTDPDHPLGGNALTRRGMQNVAIVARCVNWERGCTGPPSTAGRARGTGGGRRPGDRPQTD